MIKLDTKGSDYTIPQLDLSRAPEGTEAKYLPLYDLVTIDDETDYLGHPDAVLLKDGSILTVYPSAHGKGAIRSRVSSDKGASWQNADDRQPASWKNSRETPTVYRLEFADGTPDKLVLVSGNPDWHDGVESTGGFNYSISDDEGKSWSEFELCFPELGGKKLCTIVAMASLTRLKENGAFADKWMAFFHTGEFINYKTILSFEDGRPVWSTPEPYFSAYREIEEFSNMCEVEVIRSDEGKGDELCLITRSNSKKINSLLSFSRDEGITWSEPVTAPASLNGERHKADYLADGRLFITFRSIERSPEKLAAVAPDRSDWYSEGWIAWVGTYDDIRNGREGQYRIKVAHVCRDGRTEPERYAGSDTGYCGNAVLDGMTAFTSTYGAFGKHNADGTLKTYVACKRIDITLADELVKKL